MKADQDDQRNFGDAWIHSSCGMCLGDCGMLVHRVNGRVVDVAGDPDCPNSRGKLCSKAYSGMMSLYDPNRIQRPLKRTSAAKGLGVDPGWVPISWEEALDMLEEKLTRIRNDDPRKLNFTSFEVYSLSQVVRPWMEAFGTPNHDWVGYFCGNYLHSSMFLTNGSFHCDFDADYINYLMLFGNQTGFGAGLNPNITAQKVAADRKRGMKVVAVDPICNHAAAKADEWVPIRPGTDAALALAMIDVLLNEKEIYDREFIRKKTNGPYLVKPDGYYLRREGKPLIWDADRKEAVPYDAAIDTCAIDGAYPIDGSLCVPAFELLKDHVKKYTPEAAAHITTVPPATIRRLAEEFGREARIGSTITVEGVELPYRPVAANIYRGAGAHKHGVAAALAVQLLNMIVGAFYVPGGHRGTNLVGPSWQWAPRVHEGLIMPPERRDVGHDADFYTYRVRSPETMAMEELFPISTNRAPMNLASSVDPEKYRLPYKPEMLIVCRRNLFLGGCDYELTARALKSYGFVAAFSTHLDEMTDFADLVMPEATYFEKLQVIPNNLSWSHTAQTGYYYWGIRQPAVPPLGEARDWADVLMELAERMGFVGQIYEKFNAKYGLKEARALDPCRRYTKQEIGDRRLQSQFGPERGLAWFQKNGYFSVKRKVDERYPLPWLTARFPLYFENVMDAGKKVKEVTQRMGIPDWDVSDYRALPEWRQCRSYTPEGEFDLKACNFRVPTHYQSVTAENPWLSEVAELNPYAQKILINASTARRKGIRDRDTICVESAVGRVVGEAKVTECIHPEAVGMSSHFGSMARGKPIACGKGVNFNRLVPYDRDPVSTGIDACVMVKVYRL